MKIMLTKDLSDALLKLPATKLKEFIASVDRIKDLNKTEMLALDKTIELSREKNIDFYAYEIGDSFYILFTFGPKRVMLLLDVMELDGEELKFLVYPKQESNNKLAE